MFPLTPDQTRVLHAALHLPLFTAKELAALVDLPEHTIQALLDRSTDLVEEVAPDIGINRGSPAQGVYRLRQDMRTWLIRESVELAEQLRPSQPPDPDDLVRKAEIAINAVDSLLDLRAPLRSPPVRGADREQRVQAQLELSQQLVRLVPDDAQRAALEARLSELASRLRWRQGLAIR
jgi:plasmid maintenance system antidote protein VapI